MLPEEFGYESKKNPLNLFSQINYRNSPQPTYKLNPDHSKHFPDNKYLLYQQCLPGSIVNAIGSSKRNISRISGLEKEVDVINHTSCEAYDVPRSNDVSTYM
jgi:hypothetical protein